MSLPAATKDRIGRACYAYGDSFDPAVLAGVQAVVVNAPSGQTRARTKGYTGPLLRYRFPHVTIFDEDAVIRANLVDGAYLHWTSGGRAVDTAWTWTDPSAPEWRETLGGYLAGCRAQGADGIYLDGSCDRPPAGAEPQAYFPERATAMVAAMRSGDPSAPFLVNGAMQCVMDATRGGMQDGQDGRALTLVGDAMGGLVDGLLAEDFYLADDGHGTGPLVLAGHGWESNQNVVLGMQQRHPVSIVHLIKTEPLVNGLLTDRALYGLCSALLVKNARTLIALQPTAADPRAFPPIKNLGVPSQDAWRIADFRQADGTYIRYYRYGSVKVDPVAGKGWIL